MKEDNIYVNYLGIFTQKLLANEFNDEDKILEIKII